jgi:hypothetical protein
MQEMIKTTAAINPTRGLKDMSAAESFFSLYNPNATKGAATRNQSAAQSRGRMPSDICIAYASETVRSEK